MKKINLYTGGHPYQVNDLSTLQDGVIDGLKGIMEGVAAGHTSFIISGCTVTGATMSAGYIYYSGEIFPVDSQAVPALGSGQSYYWSVEEAVLAPSPVTYQDGTPRNVHVRRRMILVAAGSLPADSVLFSTLVRLNQILGVTPQNGIIMYSGSASNFDSTGYGKAGTQLQGWALCNGVTQPIPGGGTLPTPNLRGRFIVGFDERASGADADYSTIGNVGGEKTHTLTKAQLPPHSHGLSPDFEFGGHTHGGVGHLQLSGEGMDPGGISSLSGTPHPSEDGNADGLYGDPHENRPPYYTLAYIIKLV